jgi:lysophospholipase L1-like esterase
MLKNLSGLTKYLAYLCLATILVLLAFEGVLRIGFGLPRGRFHFRPLDNSGLYLPDSTLYMTLGPIPYTIQTNSLGFRGPEIERVKPKGTLRIVALGDSVTDGFYVDNEDTLPRQLERILRVELMEAGQDPARLEVVNAARGGASIDREYQILRKHCRPLDPDMVILTFVTNDLDTIWNRSREELVHYDAPEVQPAADSEALFFAQTAVGELLLDFSLARRYEHYRGEHVSGKDRYRIEGGNDFRANLEHFRMKHVGESILANETLNEAQKAVIENYFFALDHMNAYCKEEGIQLILAYSPPYNQVRDPDASMLLRDLIQEGCIASGIPFIDMTPALLLAGKEEILFLAPLDYHPTPAGNRVSAEAVAAFLLKENMITLP